MLEKLKTVCGKDYKLFSVDELKNFVGTNVTKDEVVAMLRRLDFGGYVDMRYCDGNEILIKPLNKQYVINEERLESQPNQKDVNVNYFSRYAFTLLASFAGAFLGAIIAIVIAGFIC